MRTLQRRLLAFAFRNLRPSAAAVAFAWMMFVIPQAEGATFTVNSLAATPDASPGDGACDDGTGHCTLAAAAMEFSPCGDMTIVLAVEGTIDGSVTFADAPPCGSSPSSLTLVGPGPAHLTIDGSLSFLNIGTVVVSGITVIGAVESSGVWILQTELDSMVVHGGGISGRLVTVRNSRVEDSPGSGVTAGGDPSAGVSLMDSVVSNSGGAGIAAVGGAGVVVGNSRIENSAGSGVQMMGYRAFGKLSLTDSTVSNSGGAGVDGQFLDPFELVRSSIVGNHGGGVVLSGSVLLGGVSATVTDSTIDSNAGAGFAANASDLVSIERSTISRNAGGGVRVGNACTSGGVRLLITDSTISGNSTADSGGGVWGSGVWGFSLTLDHDTIVTNRADADGDGVGDGGGVSFAFCPGSVSASATGTILSGNIDYGGEAPDCAGLLVSGGSNLVGSLSGCSFTGGTGDLVGVAPALGPLADNGGPTLTHALLAGSPAIDGAGTCSGTDQRGVSRPQGGACDIGAYEFACGNGTVEVGEQCDDSNLNDGDCCSASCQWETAGSSCPDDGEPCTADTCDGNGACVHAVPEARGCVPALPGGASVSLKNDGMAAHNLFSWSWKGAATVTGKDFGNPLASTDVVLCAFERTSGVPTLLLSATAPAAGVCTVRPCWTARGTSFSYRNPGPTPDGLQQLSLKPGAAGRARITVKGKGVNLSLPRPPLDPSITVRLQRSDAPACWEAEFSHTQRDDTAMFKAKSD
jgi:cysteine-rich repeat protein